MYYVRVYRQASILFKYFPFIKLTFFKVNNKIMHSKPKRIDEVSKNNYIKSS